MIDLVTLDTPTILSFITHYRKFEKAPLAEGYELIAKIADKKELQPLCDQWKIMKRDFGAFFTKLETKHQIKLLHLWGIQDPDDSFYLSQLSTNPMFGYYRDNAPRTTSQLHTLVLFFNSQLIKSVPERGFVLNHSPKGEKLAGNGETKAWGEYLLSFKDPDAIVQHVFTYALSRKW